MKNMRTLFSILALAVTISVTAQTPIPLGTTIDLGEVNINGQLDALDEFSTKFIIPVEMPDGVKLMTDITLPLTQDSMTVVIPDDVIGLAGERITLIPKGTQLFYYDSIRVNGVLQPNPDPYSLPMILTRTPYDKQGDVAGRIITIFGYAYALSDMRGRYSSEGVYFPMMSDSWNKNAYHNYFKHILDNTAMTDPKNGNRHEDGYNTVKRLVNDVVRAYDVDNDGDLDTFNVCNGSLGMFGASALGNTQYQAAAAHKIDPMGPGLKGLMPIVATLEHMKYTGYQNGVFRERIVTGWLKGQIFDVEDDLIPIDLDKQNNIHTSKDYDLPKTVIVNGQSKMYQPNQFDASSLAIDHFVRMRYPKSDGQLGLPGYYPNSDGRGDMDASHAPVDIDGESVEADGFTPKPNLIYSRYRNANVPAYHLTGWWDIFTDGQIETWRLMKNALQEIGSPNANLQKLVIGPWAHQTIGSTLTGDMEYKENVSTILGFDIGTEDLEDIAIENVLESEIVKWFRYTLNYNEYKNIGLPKVRLPESHVWQELAGGLVKVRVPSENYELKFIELINFINGTGELKGLKAEVDLGLLGVSTQTIDIPPLGDPVIPELDGEEISAAIDSADFGAIANVRFYVIGPVNDGVQAPGGGLANENAGNYWFHSDTFPIVKNIQWKNMYMHQNGRLDYNMQTEDEGTTIYIHDPDDQVYTLGGANMIVSLPDGHRSVAAKNDDSQGQINLADPRWKFRTMDREGVVSFETDVLTDTLCVIGFPEATLYAKSNPGGEVDGPTDTDFFVRILDVYPDGRQFFVVEGCVNARARDFARQIAETDGHEIDTIPFTNIEIGEIIKYHFRLMPIAYTWGIGHRMKVLISSSNHTRYQVNPNLPIEDGDFFRRQPLDGQKYVFQGEEMEPRIAVQRLFHSPEHPSHLELPVYDKNFISSQNPLPAQNSSELRVKIYPNPAVENINVYMSQPKRSYELVMLNSVGQEVYRTNFADELNIDAKRFGKGMYIIEVRDTETKETVTGKVTIQ